MKKYLILYSLLFTLFANVLFCQILCRPDQDPVWASERARLAESFNNGRQRSPSDFKVVRINYHFVLRSDGTGNFTETGDNQGNSLNGYQFAKDITSAMNSSLSYNPQMIIPPNNTIPADNKNYAYVVDAVYFHRDDSGFNFGSGTTLYNTVGADKSTVMNIFLTHGTGTAGGYAVDLPQNPTTPKWTENQSYYKRYVDFLNQVVQGDQYGWVIHGLYRNTVHELGHLLGLSHTVRYDYAPPCPTNTDNGFVDVGCDDGCSDTPTAWFMRDVLNAPRHPACGWVNATTPWCSNNMMDYNADNALTPCQLNIIHAGLDGGLKNYKTCEAVKIDNSFCDIGYPKLSYFGKIVNIGCPGSEATLTADEEAKVYFSNQVVINPTVIDGAFDVIFQATCN